MQIQKLQNFTSSIFLSFTVTKKLLNKITHDKNTDLLFLFGEESNFSFLLLDPGLPSLISSAWYFSCLLSWTQEQYKLIFTQNSVFFQWKYSFFDIKVTIYLQRTKLVQNIFLLRYVVYMMTFHVYGNPIIILLTEKYSVRDFTGSEVWVECEYFSRCFLKIYFGPIEPSLKSYNSNGFWSIFLTFGEMID